MMAAIYGIINGQAQLIQSNSLCIWHFERYEENGTLKSYIGFECTAQELIPENGEVIENFKDWMNEFETDEI